MTGGLNLSMAVAAAFATSLLLSLYLTPIFREAAERMGIVDRPDGGLKRQKEPVPYLGGLAVFVAVILPVAIFLDLSDRLVGLLFASSIIVLLGLVDDIGVLSPKIKLLGQVIAIFLMMKSGVRIRLEVVPPIACIALTFLWMLVMTNGFNLIDVMDGLSSSVATVCAIAMGIVMILQGNFMGVVVCVCLVGALAGFLRFNVAPARIYLGDTGSMFIGFLLGGLAVSGDYTRANAWGFLAAPAIFAVPLFEIVFVSWLRTLRGESILVGSRDHFALRMRKLKLSTGGIVILATAVAVVSSVLGLVGMSISAPMAFVPFACVLLLFLALGAWLKTIDMSE